ncbi:MAG: hypothetical protein Q4A15_00170 [Prevotellaceae bacterium]|nr:hypothetical protein [Prevotellaceae bacterium]
MALFSERYGYVKPRDVMIRESLSEEIINAICSAYDLLNDSLNHIDVSERRECDASYSALELSIWVDFKNQRRDDFYDFRGHLIVATEFVMHEVVWYRILDMVEYSVKWMNENFNDRERRQSYCQFVEYLNRRFKVLGFAYRIVNDEIVEITSEEEIAVIEQALTVDGAIEKHISAALALMSQRPEPDYRNSIKESISSVEYICRKITGKNTLGDALKELDGNYIVLPPMLKTAFEKLYVYTNDKTTGIRHALMDEKDTAPGFEEAKFMLVACSAFVNYIKSKLSKVL